MIVGLLSRHAVPMDLEHAVAEVTPVALMGERKSNPLRVVAARRRTIGKRPTDCEIREFDTRYDLAMARLMGKSERWVELASYNERNGPGRVPRYSALRGMN
jgi:hypothetical protein